MRLSKARDAWDTDRDGEGLLQDLETEAYTRPYVNLDKAAVLQEAKSLHDPDFVRDNPGRCCTIITRLLHLENTPGQQLDAEETTDAFFAVTKSFACADTDTPLRRCTYLFIKEAATRCNPDHVVIVTSALLKDATRYYDAAVFRSNALRLLLGIVDETGLWIAGRFLRQMLEDRSGQLNSAALVGATQLLERRRECGVILRQMMTEIVGATLSPNRMVQFHGMQLLYQIKKHKPLEMQKVLIQYFSHGGALVKSHLGHVFLIRYAAELLKGEVTEGRMKSGTAFKGGSSFARNGYGFLESSTRHESEMIALEAARAICALPGIGPRELSPALDALRPLLSSPRPAARVASARIAEEAAARHPRMVARCDGGWKISGPATFVSGDVVPEARLTVSHGGVCAAIPAQL